METSYSGFFAGWKPALRWLKLLAVRTISRYIFTEAALYFGISLLAFTGILLTLRMLRFAALVINKGVELGQIAAVFASIIPTFLEIALPLSALLGMMLAFGRLSGDSEIIVLRSSGVSIIQLVTPVAVFGLLVCALCFFVTLKLSPWGNQNLSRTLFDIARTKATAGLEAGVFNKLGLLTLYTEEIEHGSGRISRVLIDDKRAERKIVISKDGYILSDEDNQTIILMLKNGVVHEIIDNKYVLTDFVTNRIIMSPEDLNEPGSEKKDKRAREMYVKELTTRIDEMNLAAATPPITTVPTEEEAQELRDAQKRWINYQIELGRRFSMPFACLALAFMGMALGIHPPRLQKTWGVGLSVALAMTVFVCYYGLISVGMTMAENRQINPYLPVWIPNLFAAGLAYLCITKLGHEKWHSVVEGMSQLVIALRAKALEVRSKYKWATI